MSTTETTRQVSLNDIERLIELDFVRATEAAALNAHRWLGKGDAKEAHDAAVDAIRGALETASVRAKVCMGDGMSSPASGIEAGEIIGGDENDALDVEVAILPIDGVKLVSEGRPGAICALLASTGSGENHFKNIPCRYMDKLAFGPGVNAGPGKVHLNASVRDNLEIVASKLGKRVKDLSISVLDRDRHTELVAQIRKAGSSVVLIQDGDLAACMAPCFPDTGIDMYMGKGGGVEAVMAASAIKCLGGDILARVAPENDQEKQAVIDTLGNDALDTIYTAEDLVPGDNVVFSATSISHTKILPGIFIKGSLATTNSVVMRARYRTIRYMRTEHDLSLKKIRLHSTKAESEL